MCSIDKYLLVNIAVLIASTNHGLADRPNILWITSEDNGPHLGCYGDNYATTPNLDALAERSMIYLNAWSNAPVCAPARTAIITGMYPQSLGGQHMRSMVRMPQRFKLFPQYLRKAGYYCTNNSKQDYNVQTSGKIWDQSSRKAHWKNREATQPFFSVFNFTITHESKIRSRPHKAVHDPSGVRVPAYHPDTPAVRQDWAQYYDRISEMDVQVGDVLEQLRKAGLEEETIIFYFADHGSGMPRHKRWPYNSGLHVPLIIHVPEKFKSIALKEHVLGGSTERLVSFVDLAPTALSLCGIQPPSHMQGRAFLGEFTTEPKSFLHGFRGRMDERIDMVRSVRDKRFIYIRNYLPHRIYGQHVEYMFQTPTTRVWKQRFDQGKLNEIQSRFWKAKPAEELYDLESDPDETKNLADSPDHVAIKSRLQNAQRELALQIRDLGFMPEGEIHRRSGDQSPYDMARDEIEYPIASILSAAEKASSSKVAKSMDLLPLSHRDSAVRYWAAIQRLNQDKAARSKYETQLQRLIESDDSPDVRVAAAEVLIHSEQPAQFGFALESLIKTAKTINQGPFPAIAALNAIDSIQVIDRLSNDQKRDLVASLHGLGVEYPEAHKRYQGYVARLVKHILTELNER